jgi:hypothetical protein
VEKGRKRRRQRKVKKGRKRGQPQSKVQKGRRITERQSEVEEVGREKRN